jgi:hypothetical protein
MTRRREGGSPLSVMAEERWLHSSRSHGGCLKLLLMTNAHWGNGTEGGGKGTGGTSLSGRNHTINDGSSALGHVSCNTS